MVATNKVRLILNTCFIIGYNIIFLHHPTPLLPRGGDYRQCLFIHYSFLHTILLTALVTRVVLEDFLTQRGGIDVCIDFGGANVLVTQHRLDDTQVGAALEQGGGEGVTQRVRRNGFLDACSLSLTFHHNKNHRACEVGTATVEEHIVFLSRLNSHEVAIVEP